MDRCLARLLESLVERHVWDHVPVVPLNTVEADEVRLCTNHHVQVGLVCEPPSPLSQFPTRVDRVRSIVFWVLDGEPEQDRPVPCCDVHVEDLPVELVGKAWVSPRVRISSMGGRDVDVRIDLLDDSYRDLLPVLSSFHWAGQVDERPFEGVTLVFGRIINTVHSVLLIRPDH